MAKGPHFKGFTLVELLVVVGIIALLISFLMPALNTARERARVLHCTSNERQTWLALHIYAADFRQYPMLPDWSQVITVQGLPVNYGAPGVTDDVWGYGGGVWQMMLDRGYFQTSLKVARCEVPIPSPTCNAAGWYGANQNYYFYASPGSCGSGIGNYGHGSGLYSHILGMNFTNYWVDSARGFSLRGETRKAENCAQLVCRGFIDVAGGAYIVYEPHGKQRAAALGGAHQFSEGYPYRARNYLYADGHIVYELKE